MHLFEDKYEVLSTVPGPLGSVDVGVRISPPLWKWLFLGVQPIRRTYRSRGLLWYTTAGYPLQGGTPLTDVLDQARTDYYESIAQRYQEV